MLKSGFRYAWLFFFYVGVYSDGFADTASTTSTLDLLQKDLKVVSKNSPEMTRALTNGFFTVPVHVNDSTETRYFVIDTGSTASAIDIDVAKGLGIVSTDNNQIRGGTALGMGGGTVSIKIAQQVRLSFAGVTATGVMMALLPHASMWAISRNMGRNCAGILGYDVLRRLVLKMNYTTGSIAFLSSQKFVRDPKAATLPLNSAELNPKILMTVKLDKQDLTGTFLLDTGSNSGVKIYPPFLTDHPDLRVNSIGTGTSYGLGGAFTFRIMRAQALELGPFILSDADFEVLGCSSSNLRGEIGNEIWSRFDVVIDGPDSRCYLKPNKVFAYPFLTKLLLGGLGISVAQDSARQGPFQVVILQVNPQGQAAKAGAKVGDVLTKINSESTFGMSLQEVMLNLDKRVSKIDVLRGRAEIELTISSSG